MRTLLNRLKSWDFIRMGRGIEARYSRCAPFWQPHLSCTRSFIHEHLVPGGRLAVLGAGRLLDLDLKHLMPLFSEIHLFDADPGVVKAWREVSGIAFRDVVIPRVVDVTGSLDTWTHGLRTAIKQGTLPEYLDGLQPQEGAWESEKFDGIISLNLAGQLPIYWRDRVLKVVSDPTEAEERALLGSMAKLQIAHLKALRTAPRGWSIVITDTEYYTYHVDSVEWEVEDALYGNAREELSSEFPEFARRGEGCWLWHLVPQFVESDAAGHIHRVEAMAWERR